MINAKRSNKNVEVQKLRADQRPKARYSYTVEGEAPFPFDMLRYDAAHPRTQADIRGLASQPGERVRVALDSFASPTVDRWASFGWAVLWP